MRHARLPASVLVAGLVGASTVVATASSASAPHDSWENHLPLRCSHHANPPADDDPSTIEIGDTTRYIGFKKMRGFRKVRETKRACVFNRKASQARLRLHATYRPGTRPKMSKLYFKARKKPGFKLIRFAKGSKVHSSHGRRTVLEYTFRHRGKRRHVRIHGDAHVLFKVSSPQRTWKASKRAAGKIRRGMRVYNLTAL
ncbi:MAG TPA: hypothetical protein VK059_04520 [Nocardioidaceae bacterium]|nr:hypothetical protein [Nocardioidaceae bacterium]